MSRPELVPAHVGLILDGNRRWASAQGLPKLEGHRRGYENLYTIARRAKQRGVQFVSAYVFSTENWERSKREVAYLMNLLVWVATVEIEKYDQEGIRLVVLGSRRRLSRRVLKAIESAEARTAHNVQMTLGLCLNYGGHLELAEGVARLVAEGVRPEAITPECISSYLYHPEIPPIDLLIRTSGEQRLSNFMLWRAAYAELWFCAKHWPAFTALDFDDALANFAKRQRRFGS